MHVDSVRTKDTILGFYKIKWYEIYTLFPFRFKPLGHTLYSLCYFFLSIEIGIISHHQSITQQEFWTEVDLTWMEVLKGQVWNMNSTQIHEKGHLQTTLKYIKLIDGPRIFALQMLILIASLVLEKIIDFYVNFEGGFTIFIESFKVHHNLTGATAPTSLCLGPPLITFCGALGELCGTTIFFSGE